MVNASSLSPPRSQYQWNWRYKLLLSILQSNNNDTRSRVFVEACVLRPSLDCFSAFTPKKPAKRGPKLKQIGTSDYCSTCGCFEYLNSILGNYPVPMKLQRESFESVRQVLQNESCGRYDLRDLSFTVSQTEDQSSRVCSHGSNQV